MAPFIDKESEAEGKCPSKVIAVLKPRLHLYHTVRLEYPLAPHVTSPVGAVWHEDKPSLFHRMGIFYLLSFKKLASPLAILQMKAYSLSPRYQDP